MTRKIKYILFITLFSALLFSCASKKTILYVQDIDMAKSYESLGIYGAKLQPDDILSIIVSAENPEITVPFNLTSYNINASTGANMPEIQTYLINNNGDIDFPVIGKIKLGGLTTIEATDKLVNLISQYIKNPSVNLRIHNYKISVIGEVTKPGTFPVKGERITLLEGLSFAGDLTIYGNRNNIVIIRENEGIKTYARVDITKAEFLNSPYYYLAQNDVVYVEPNKTKVNSSVIGPNITVIFAGLSLLLTIIVLFTK